jgi:hypothetical protein
MSWNSVHASSVELQKEERNKATDITQIYIQLLARFCVHHIYKHTNSVGNIHHILKITNSYDMKFWNDVWKIYCNEKVDKVEERKVDKETDHYSIIINAEFSINVAIFAKAFKGN